MGRALAASAPAADAAVTSCSVGVLGITRTSLVDGLPSRRPCKCLFVTGFSLVAHTAPCPAGPSAAGLESTGLECREVLPCRTPSHAAGHGHRAAGGSCAVA